MDDGRRKLHPGDDEKIRSFYASVHSQRETAAKFGVSRRTITFILYPERLKIVQEKRKKTKYSQNYYNSVARGEAWRDTMRKYRKKKREKGLLYNPAKHN